MVLNRIKTQLFYCVCGQTLQNEPHRGKTCVQFFLSVCFDTLRPSQQFADVSGRFSIYLGCSIKQRIKCLAQGHHTVTLPAVILELAVLG